VHVNTSYRTTSEQNNISTLYGKNLSYVEW